MTYDESVKWCFANKTLIVRPYDERGKHKFSTGTVNITCLEEFQTVQIEDISGVTGLSQSSPCVVTLIDEYLRHMSKKLELAYAAYNTLCTLQHDVRMQKYNEE